MQIGDCYIGPLLGGRLRSIWRIASIDGGMCRADLYDFSEQGIYRYRGEPFSVKRFALFVPVEAALFDRVEALFEGALRRAEEVCSTTPKLRAEHIEFGTCLYTEEPDYKGVMKLIEQSGENSLLGEYIHVSPKQFSRETIRPGIVSLSQYEDAEGKLSIEASAYDKLLKVMNLTCASIQALVNGALAAHRLKKESAIENTEY